MGSENGPRLTRREFNWLLAGIVSTAATGGAATLVKNLTTPQESKDPFPYIEDEVFLEFVRRNRVSFTLHDAADDSEKTKLVIDNPEIFTPEINVAPSYGKLYNAHYPRNIEWLNPEEREERKLEKVFETFANAGVKKFEFDLKYPFDLYSFMSFIDFLGSLRDSEIKPIISGDSVWVSQIPDFSDVIPNDTEVVQTLKSKQEVLAYQRELEYGWGNENSGATVSNRSPFRDEIIRLNQANNRPTKIFGFQRETDALNLGSEQDTTIEGAKIIIGTDEPRLIQRAIQANTL